MVEFGKKDSTGKSKKSKFFCDDENTLVGYPARPIWYTMLKIEFQVENAFDLDCCP